MTMGPWQIIEAVAAVGNLAYTVLMLYEKRIGWLFGIIASAMGAGLFLHQHVYAQSVLSAFYVAMGVYGWWSWGRGKDGALPISRRGLGFHALIIAGGVVLTIAAASLLKLFPEAQHTGLDGFTTAFSILATWMLARKVLENWAYWIIADLVAIQLYVLLDLRWYAALYAIYVALSISALVRWGREWRAMHGR